jgi:hypothetical protein
MKAREGKIILLVTVYSYISQSLNPRKLCTPPIFPTV